MQNRELPLLLLQEQKKLAFQVNFSLSSTFKQGLPSTPIHSQVYLQVPSPLCNKETKPSYKPRVSKYHTVAGGFILTILKTIFCTRTALFSVIFSKCDCIFYLHCSVKHLISLFAWTLSFQQVSNNCVREQLTLTTCAYHGELNFYHLVQT